MALQGQPQIFGEFHQPGFIRLEIDAGDGAQAFQGEAVLVQCGHQQVPQFGGRGAPVAPHSGHQGRGAQHKDLRGQVHDTVVHENTGCGAEVGRQCLPRLGQGFNLRQVRVDQAKGIVAA